MDVLYIVLGFFSGFFALTGAFNLPSAHDNKRVKDVSLVLLLFSILGLGSMSIWSFAQVV